MKKMILFLMALFSLTLITGCGEKKTQEVKPIDVFAKSVENMQDVKSLEIVSTIKAKYKDQGVSVDVDVPITFGLSQTEENLDMRINIGENPFLSKVDAYLNVNSTDKKVNIYFPASLVNLIFGSEETSDKWLNYKGAISDITGEDVKVETDDLDKLNNIDYKKVIGDNFAYVDSSDGINHYQLTINQNLIDRFAQEVKEKVDDTLNVDEIDKLTQEFKLDFYISKEYNNLTKISADLRSLLETDEEFEYLENFEEFSFKVEFKNVNNTTISVPDDVKTNAIDAKEYIEQMMGQLSDPTV